MRTAESVGASGPCPAPTVHDALAEGSVSTSSVRLPRRAKPTARAVAVHVFPDPPLRFVMAIRRMSKPPSLREIGEKGQRLEQHNVKTA